MHLRAMHLLTGLSLVLTALPFGSSVPHDPDGRIRALDELIAKRPAEAELYLRRGELQRQVGHLGRSLRDFDRAQKLAPQLAAVHFGRALTLRDQGSHQAALESIERFLAKVPDHGEALLTRARALVRLTRYRAAAATFDRAVEKLPRLTPEHVIEQAMAHAATGTDGIEPARERIRRGIERLGPLVSLTSYGKRLGLEPDAARAFPRRTPATAATRPPTGAPPPTANAGEVIAVPFRSSWKFKDDGSDQGTNWRAPAFDDSSWSSGLAELGYGDGDEVTTVGYGTDPKNKFITTYFRHTFTLPTVAGIARARMRLVRDDGVVVYLNGQEIARDNMPAGAVSYTTLASSDIDRVKEVSLLTVPIDHRLLQAGTNVLAVEIHQYAQDSDDISHDLELRVSDGVTIVERGPYLQQVGPSSAIVRWRTDYPTETVAYLGSTASNVIPVVQNNTPTTEHTALLTGLTPDTRYFYAIGSKAGVLRGGADVYFTTAPNPGATKRTRIWAIGDSGTADANAAAVRTAYLRHTGNTPTDLWLMLGDNAYLFGQDPEYQRAVFDMYPDLLRTSCLWPTIGNHDVYSSLASHQVGPYYDIFTLPTQGEIGGVASGTESYYSFDHGDIHFISLNSADSPRSPVGPMITWLVSDLAATQAKWIIAFWHHPPYSKGSHDSDNFFELEMIEMRQNVLPILEWAGVDLVLTGHSHSYERSFLLDGHYGFSPTLQKGMLRDQGNGRPQSQGAYAKPTLRRGANEGAVYVVAGCAGSVAGGALNHRAMAVSMNTLGSLVIDIDGDELQAKFLSDSGTVEDSFTILKGVKRTLNRDVAEVSLSTGGAQTLVLTAGAAHAGRFYQIAGSFGTSPGFSLGGVHIPLNDDPWLRFTLAFPNSGLFQGTLGILDFAGESVARIAIPPTNFPPAIGVTLHHAYVVYDAAGIHMASNPVSLTMGK